MSETRLIERAVIRLATTDDGEDIREFLQGLVTQDMALVQPGTPQWCALLTAQGKVLFDFFLWADGDDILIDCEKGQAETLVKRLKLYRLRRKISIAIDQDLGVHWRAPGEDREPSATKRDDASGLLLSQEHETPDPRLPQLGSRWLGDISVAQGAEAEYLTHRLSLGVTEGQAELGSDKTLWLECNADELNGVSFTKGCYVGQENTARMNYRNKVNRRMVVVPLDQADEKRQRIAYPELGLSVEHRRVDDLNVLDLPEWLAKAV